MPLTQITAGLYMVPLGFVNVFLIDDDRGLTLIDTGMPGSAAQILAAVSELGRQPQDVQHILVSHCHIDHTGSLAALKAATGAEVWMHRADAELVRVGQSGRPMRPAPRLLPWLVTTLFMRPSPQPVEAVTTDHEIDTEAELPVAGGIRAIHAPGHSAGQLAFLWPRAGGVLIAGDAAANFRGKLGPSVVYEDLDLGVRTLLRLAGLDFEIACFGHGKPIIGGAAQAFRNRWPGARRAGESYIN